MNRINRILPADETAKKRAADKWNNVAKPLHSLGLLEDIIIKMAGIYKTENFTLDKRCVVDMCADNGVVCEGVTQTDSGVTAIVAKSMAESSSNINLMGKVCGADVFAVDIGIDGEISADGLICKKVANGTKNITQTAAMTTEEAKTAIKAGMDIVGDLQGKGYKLIVTGEMGIGNTTTSAAVASILTGKSPEFVTGRGAGLDDMGLERKINAVKRAIAVNMPDPENPLDVLSKLGGFDIAGMTGLFLGGAYYRVPIVIDGFISAISAALAAKINPLAKEYMLCSHVSKEPAGRLILEMLELKAPITAELCLGEGTGGVLLLPMIDAALAVYNSSHRFENLAIEKYKEL